MKCDPPSISFRVLTLLIRRAVGRFAGACLRWVAARSSTPPVPTLPVPLPTSPPVATLRDAAPSPPVPDPRWLDTVKRDVLRVTLDPENPLAALRGNALVLSDVFGRVRAWWLDSHLDRTSTAWYPVTDPYSTNDRFVFPEPRDINVNMMPILFWHSRVELPEGFRQYGDVIRVCRVPMKPARIAYLTIQEGWVPVGTCQRRPGPHVERPGGSASGKGRFVPATPASEQYNDSEYRDLAWGGGYVTKDGGLMDGIFVASSVAGTTRVWSTLVDRPEEVTDVHGGLPGWAGEGGVGSTVDTRNLDAGEVCWITDRTPHESLPVRAPPNDPNATRVYRQFFRLVVGPISVWHSKHNTPSPVGVLPDAPVSDDSKFGEDCTL